MDALTKLKRARIYLTIKYPFYGSLAMHLILKENTEIETAGTDGEIFYYNPKFVNNMSESELTWLLTHEVMHCALGHMWRQGTRNSETYNKACDYAIHSILKESESSDFQMPEGGLYDERFNKLSSEEIYEKILQDQQKGGKGKGKSKSGGRGKGNGDSDDEASGSGNGKGSGQGGNSGKGKTLDDHSFWNKSKTQKDKENKENEWKQNILSSYEATKGSPGSIPSSISRLIDKLIKPQKNWKQLLHDCVEYEVHDYGFTPPDKRLYAITECCMPDFSEETPIIKDLVVCIDTSGSIGQNEFRAFVSELVGMIQQFKGVKGHLIYADADVSEVVDFENEEDILNSQPKGFGGTDFTPAIKYAMDKQKNNEWDVSALIYLTDLEGSWQDEEVNKNTVPFKTLWVSTIDPDQMYEQYKPDYGIITYLNV